MGRTDEQEIGRSTSERALRDYHERFFTGARNLSEFFFISFLWLRAAEAKIGSPRRIESSVLGGYLCLSSLSPVYKIDNNVHTVDGKDSAQKACHQNHAEPCAETFTAAHGELSSLTPLIPILHVPILGIPLSQLRLFPFFHVLTSHQPGRVSNH